MRLSILNRYILGQLAGFLLMTLAIFTLLFLVFDFFDRIDNIITERPRIGIVLEYFLLKIPQTVVLMLPVAILVSTLMTVGLLSRNSELTAIRAAGVTVVQIAAPIIAVGFLLSLVSVAINELAVPYSSRRVREIYNIDIKQKQASGAYSQNDFWWRAGRSFYSVGVFDSRNSTLSGLSRFDVVDDMKVVRRVNADQVTYLDPILGWNMYQVAEYRFVRDPSSPDVTRYDHLPLPIAKQPTDFYDAETDPATMSFQALRRFIKEQKENGLGVDSYYADLHAKFSFPFVCMIMPLIVLPFSVKPARSGSMAASIFAALCIGFGYYVVHSFAISLGRAEILPPAIAAWLANILMACIGAILLAGAENPL